MRINDAILGLIILAFSVFVMVEAGSYRGLPGVPYGPGLFPSVIAGAMLLGGCILVYQGVRRRPETGWYSLDPWARRARTYVTLCAVFSALLFYVLFSERLGFLVTSTILLLMLMLWTRGKKRLLSSLIISVLFSVTVYLVFSELLRVPLPRGLMDGIF